MTDKPKPAPKKTTRPPAPKAAPKPAVPSVTFAKSEGKGKLAAAVATTVGALGLIGYGIVGVAGKMLRRGR